MCSKKTLTDLPKEILVLILRHLYPSPSFWTIDHITQHLDALRLCFRTRLRFRTIRADKEVFHASTVCKRLSEAACLILEEQSGLVAVHTGRERPHSWTNLRRSRQPAFLAGVRGPARLSGDSSRW